jgi:hypothetical protein
MSTHKKKYKKGSFCAVRKKPCKCGNNYRTNCDPGWKYQAHHVLCVHSVASEIVSRPGIDPIVKATKWCVNHVSNTYGMPLWGYTVKHYCKIRRSAIAVASGPPEPAFKDIPQHDWDHNSVDGYTDEVDIELAALSDKIEKSKASHETKVKNIFGALNSKSRSFRSRLKRRGKRGRGTHNSWKQGGRRPNSNWCLPFSMAVTGSVNKRPFPTKSWTNILARWIAKYSAQLAGG